MQKKCETCSEKHKRNDQQQQKCEDDQHDSHFDFCFPNLSYPDHAHLHLLWTSRWSLQNGTKHCTNCQIKHDIYSDEYCVLHEQQH